MREEMAKMSSAGEIAANTVVVIQEEYGEKIIAEREATAQEAAVIKKVCAETEAAHRTVRREEELLCENQQLRSESKQAVSDSERLRAASSDAAQGLVNEVKSETDQARSLRSDVQLAEQKSQLMKQVLNDAQQKSSHLMSSEIHHSGAANQLKMEQNVFTN